MRTVYCLMVNDSPYEQLSYGLSWQELASQDYVRKFNSWFERQTYVNKLLDKVKRLRIRRFKLYKFEVVIH